MSINKETLQELRIDRGRTSRSLPWGIVFSVIGTLAVVGGVLLAVGHHKSAAAVRTAVAAESRGGGAQTVLNASGYVTARRQATVSSKITGQIIEVDFEEGQRVEAGQVLARVDPSNIKTSLALAQAQLESARVALEETKVQLEQSERELKRSQALVERAIISQSDLDRAQSDAATLRARLARQTADVLVAEKQVGTWQQQLEDTVIRAPFSGVIVSKTAQPGEIISPMSAGGAYTRTGVCTIVDMASLEVEVDVSENYINRVESGQRSEAVLDAYTDWHIPSKVIAVIPTADRQKATVKVRVGFDKLDPRILPDMGVKVSFQATGATNEVSRVVTVPRSAVRKDGTRDVVFVVTKGRAERRAVKLGTEHNGEVPVLSNLAGGETVVTDAPGTLKDGDPVKESKL